MASSLDHLSDEVQAALRADLTIDITTTGRTSGRDRRIEIWFLNIDDAIYIAGTPGRRDWMANLQANPEFTFHLKETTHADLAANAAVVDDHDERQRVLSSPQASWYRQQGDDPSSLIAEAPMVRITFPG